MKPKPLSLIIGGLGIIFASTFLPEASDVEYTAGWVVLLMGTWLCGIGIYQIGTDVYLRNKEREHDIYKN